MNQLENQWMERALTLAQQGLGTVSPNPMVGCVIVHNNKIIGEGWHQHYGDPHAEVNAIESVLDKSLLKDATAYVTLEPCSHFGKTPPCADLLIKHQVKKVVIANKDTFPQVNGSGIEKLEKAGIAVVSDVLKEKGEEVNKRFFTFHAHKRPYIILKWAQTSDGFVARENFDSKWISNEQSRKVVHKWRSEEDAILVGTNTAQYDDPALNVRDWLGKNPLRLVIDKSLRLPKTLKLFDQQISTVCYNTLEDNTSKNLDYVKLSSDDMINGILKDLYQRNIQSLIVEGGSVLLSSMIEMGLWDEARVFTASVRFEKGIKAPNIVGRLISKSKIDTDDLSTYSRK